MIGLPDEWIEAVRHDDSNTQRLVLSDWLEEQGERDKALFIRAQVVIAEHGAFCTAKKTFKTYQGSVVAGVRVEKGGYCQCVVCKARIDERILLKQNSHNWFLMDAANNMSAWWIFQALDRGFIRAVIINVFAINLDSQVGIAQNPMVYISLQEKKPRQNKKGFRWSLSRGGQRRWASYFEPHLLPQYLRGYVTERIFKTEQEALDHANEGCLRYMRGLAEPKSDLSSISVKGGE